MVGSAHRTRRLLLTICGLWRHVTGPPRASRPVCGRLRQSDRLLANRAVSVAPPESAGPAPARRYRLVMPPSTRNSAPVAYADSSLARNTMIPVTSSGVPGRPSGVRDTIAARAAGSPEIVETSDVSV